MFLCDAFKNSSGRPVYNERFEKSVLNIFYLGEHFIYILYVGTINFALSNEGKQKSSLHTYTKFHISVL
jgi:hypothetical protein